MADSVFGGLLSPSDEAMVTDFLGRESPVAARGQATVPVGGAPVAPSGAPVAPGGTGVSAAPSGATPGGPSAKPGGSSLLQNAQLAGKVADRLSKLIPSGDTATKGGGVNPDPNAPEAQQGSGLPTPSLPSTPPVEMDLMQGFPNEIIPQGGGGVNPDAFAPEAIQGSGEAAAEGELASASSLGAYAPYAAAALAAAQTLPGIAARAEGKMPAMEQALLGGTEVFGHVAAPFTLGMSEGATAVLEPTIMDLFGKPHKTKAQSAALGNRDLGQSYGVLQDALGFAQTPEEIADAFSTIEGAGYRDNKMPYPVAQGFDVRDRAALLKALGGDDPNALNFAWQGFGTEDAAKSANTALNQSVRQQMGLIRAAQAGDPQAAQALQTLKQAREAMQAQQRETEAAARATQEQESRQREAEMWAGRGDGDGGAGAP